MNTPIPVYPPGPYNANQAPSIIQCVILGSVTTTAVILRFLARSRTKANYGPDDWFALIALLLYWVILGFNVNCGQNGSQYDLTTLPLPVLITYLKSIYVVSAISPSIMTATKLSILFFYHRVFGTQRGFRIANITVGILCLMWWIGVTLVGCLRCSPVAAQWDPTIPNPNCIALSKILITGETPNSLLDFIIIALPIGVIKNLHLPLQQKINIGFICVLVAFVGVIGFIRIAITFRPVVDLEQFGLWLNIQYMFAIVCCCLPVYRPLLPSRKTLSSLRERYASLLGGGWSTGASTSHSKISPNGPTHKDVSNRSWNNQQYRKFGDSESDVVGLTYTSEAVAGKSRDGRDGRFVAGKDYPMNAINVKSNIDVV